LATRKGERLEVPRRPLLRVRLFFNFYFMTKGKIIFKGHFFEYFLMSLGLLVLSFVTLGIMLPYFVYWQMKYFVANLEIEME
jgi:uncharacterized membrane protein YjgN (DUF898 family)